MGRSSGSSISRHPWLVRSLSVVLTRPWRWGVLFLLGAIASFAFAPFFYTILMAIALSGLLIFLCLGQGRWQGFSDGWWFGFGHFITGLYWISESFARQPTVPDELGPLAVLLLSACLALFPALAGLITNRLITRGTQALLAFAVVFGAVEWLRGHVFTGFPWNPVAALWSGFPVMMQPLAVIGTYGLGVLTIFILASPVLLLSAFGGRRGWIVTLIAGLILIGWAGLGVWRLAANPTSWVAETTLRLVQPNIPQMQKWDSAQDRQNFADYLSMTGSLPFPEGRLIAIWPETAIIDADFDRTMGRRAIIAHMLPEKSSLITGAPRRFVSDDNRWRIANSLFVLNHDGVIVGQYDKHHLVPFGEYLPARVLLSHLGLKKLTEGSLDFTSGAGVITLDMPDLPTISPLICYEVIFPGAVIDSNHRPELLVNITNDAWFGTSIGPHQHFAQSRMRAVEEGIPLARAAGTGISAIIDPYGRIVTHIPLDSRGVRDASLPQSLDKRTVYSLIGDWPLLLMVLLVSAMALLSNPARYERVII